MTTAMNNILAELRQGEPPHVQQLATLCEKIMIEWHKAVAEGRADKLRLDYLEGHCAGEEFAVAGLTVRDQIDLQMREEK